MRDKFKFCPKCGNALTLAEVDGRDRLRCTAEACDFVHWDNPTPVVAAIVEVDGAVILTHKREWPAKMYGLVAGFLEKGETPEAGVLREIQEEVGLAGEIVEFVGYYSFLQRNQLILVFHVRAQGEPLVGEELAAIKLVKPEDLRPWPIGTGPAVRDWLERRQARDTGKTRMSITLRRATPQDKPRILEISSQMWDGDDYVPDVIDQWLADQGAELMVALLDGQVVAFARCMWLLPGYAWFEGIRTDPARQNRGVGKALTHHFLDQVARAGARHVGLWSCVDNEASIHIVEAHGFTRVAAFVYVEADAESPARQEARPSTQAVNVSPAEAQGFVRDSTFLTLSRGRLPCNWRFYPFDLSAETVLTRMEHRIGIRDGDRLTALVCANEPAREGKPFTVDYLDGDPAGVEALARHALHLARRASTVEVMVPRWGEQAGCALAVARRLGFKAWYDFEPDMFVYEREIEQTEGTPGPEDA